MHICPAALFHSALGPPFSLVSPMLGRGYGGVHMTATRAQGDEFRMSDL